MARPRKPQPGEHVPTQESHDLARSLFLGGSTFEDIAFLFSIDAITLVKHYRQDLEMTFQQMRAVLGKTLYDDALNGNEKARELWLTTRGKWHKAQPVQQQVVVDNAALEEFVKSRQCSTYNIDKSDAEADDKTE